MITSEPAAERDPSPTMPRRQMLALVAGLGAGAVGLSGCGRRRGLRLRVPRTRTSRTSTPDAAPSA